MEQKARQLIIFLAGELQNKEHIREFIDRSDADFYAADAGYKYAQEFGVELKRVFGDFDSAEIPDATNLTVYPCEKDQTDSELALDLAISDGYSSIWMIAPFGGRLDHTVANIALLEKAKHSEVELKLYDGENLAFLLEEGEHILPSGLRYISFFPIDESAAVSLCNFKYPLKNKTIRRMIPLAISNEPAGEDPKITVHHGTVLCICIEQEAK